MFRALPDAVARISSRTPVGSALRTREWQDLVPAEIRDQALFAAGVESARVLETMQQKLRQAVALERQSLQDGGTLVSRDQFVARMKGVLAEEGLGTGEGGLTDISSAQRLRLIYDTQVDRAHAYARHVAGQDEDLLDAFPAQELIRIEQREKPRDWTQRWTAAGGRVFGGRMIALKSDPIWAKLSRFGQPFPPFDFGSGMGVEDVSRREAEDLGLLKRGETPKPAPNTGMGAPEVSALPEATTRRLRNLFGDQLVQEEGRLRFDRAPLQRVVEAATAQQAGDVRVNLGEAWPNTRQAFEEALGTDADSSVAGFSLEVSAQDVRALQERAPAGTTIDAEALQQLAAVWRSPEAVLRDPADGNVRLGKRIGDKLWLAKLARSRNRTLSPTSLSVRAMTAEESA